MSAVWQVQEAKNHFGTVIDRALTEGPQTVTRHGKPVVRVVAIEEANAPAALADDGFLAFLLSIPKIEGGLPEMPRNRDPGRQPLFGEG